MTAPLPRRRLLHLLGMAAMAACARPVASPDGAVPSSPSERVGATPSPTAPVAPPTPPPTSPTPAVTTTPAATVHLLCRASWGARVPGDGLREHTIEHLTVHHSAAVASDPTRGPSRLRGYQRFHMDDRRWPDIAYHVGVDQAGHVYGLRHWDHPGDTGTDYEPAGHFLLLLDGNFEQHGVPEAQFTAAARVLAWAADHFDVGLDTVAGHRDHAATACPGAHLYARLAELTTAARVLAGDGGVQLVEVCGPGAEAAVAAIERGDDPAAHLPAA